VTSAIHLTKRPLAKHTVSFVVFPQFGIANLTNKIAVVKPVVLTILLQHIRLGLPNRALLVAQQNAIRQLTLLGRNLLNSHVLLITLSIAASDHLISHIYSIIVLIFNSEFSK
jgi:hypothetical protein